MRFSRAELNVTPLIDVLLVLLIIFMVITPLTPRGFDTRVPQPPPPDQKQQEPARDVVITVRSDRTVLLNQVSVPLNDLPGRLLRVFKRNTDQIIFIRADAGLEFQQVAHVIDITKAAVLDRLALITK